jgi:hypothetical protein
MREKSKHILQMRLLVPPVSGLLTPSHETPQNPARAGIVCGISPGPQRVGMPILSECLNRSDLVLLLLLGLVM